MYKVKFRIIIFVSIIFHKVNAPKWSQLRWWAEAHEKSHFFKPIYLFRSFSLILYVSVVAMRSQNINWQKDLVQDSCANCALKIPVK